MLKTQNKYFIFDRMLNYNFKYFIKKILHVPFNIIYKLSLFFFRPRIIIEKRYKVSVCAIFKNESLYFREWLEYHKIVGVQHFYLYNNNSEDNYDQVLSPYIESGLVTLIQWPQNQAQMQAYHHCIENFSNETEWFTFIDLDEFIVPNTTDTVYDFLKPFRKKCPVVIAYWKMFGTSGLISRDMQGLIVENLTVCWNKYTDIGKLFFNTAYSFDKEDKHNKALHHYMWGRYGGINLPPVNIFNKICTFGKNPIPYHVDPSYFPLQINHYFTKTYNEYLKKCAKGDVYFTINPHDESYFYQHEQYNQSVDYRIYKYMIKLKLALGIQD